MSLMQQWIGAKEAERLAIERRREIEDQLVKELHIDESHEGTETFEREGYVIKVVGKLSRKVNSDMIQEIAAESGMEDFLSSLFRWKPEINMTAWKSTDHKITETFLPAITTTPGRPGFSISIKEQ